MSDPANAVRRIRDLEAQLREARQREARERERVTLLEKRAEALEEVARNAYRGWANSTRRAEEE